ncbi:MAG: Ig-like domain-containing protein [Spirochaetota bacterium]
MEVDGVEEIGWTNIAGTPAASIDFNETIDTDAAGGGVYEIFLEAGDGTFTRESRVSVFVDLTDPALTFDAPSSASTQNNIISITGAASDNYDVQSVDFRIVDPNTGGTEQELPTGTPSGTTNWSIVGFDTRDETLLTYADDLGGGVYELTLRAIVTDAAGNTYTTAGGDDLVFLIDQATDRPVVTFDEIATDGSSTIETTIIRGSVTDDDGVGAIQVDTYAVDDSVTVESVALTSGSYGDESVDWRITLTGAGNGTRGIRVQATDTVDNDPNSSTDTGRIDFQLDTEDPDVAIDAPASDVTWSGNDTFTVSGTSGDETGVTAIAYKVDDNDFSSGTTSVPDGAGNDWATWEFTIDQSSLADGPHTIYVQATDSVGNTRVASRQVSVDKTAPTVTIVSPSNGEAVFGPLTIGGTAADNSGGAGVDSIAIGLGKQIDPGDLEGSTWTSVAGTTSWSFDFLNINDYANTTYSVNTGDTDGDGIEDGDETWTDLWNFTFYVRAVDSAGESGDGNVSYLTSYTLQIDPKRDRPEVTILSPSDGDTVGGFVRVFGSAFDSQFVEKVQIAIDANNNGDYTDDTWAEGTLDETDAGTNWYLADGTTSWSVRLNENSEFNPTGADETRTIAFKVRAKDYKSTPGDGIYGAEVEYSITFNKSFPQFSAMSLESGATVGGTVTLSGLVRDETDLGRIVFSNEGPLLDNTTIFQNPGSLVQETFNQDVSSAAATSAGITVEMLGTSDPEFPTGYTGRVYRVNIPIDTEAAGLYPNGAGSMSVKLTAEDVTASPYTNQYLLSLSVDNVDPSDLAYTGAAEIVGTEAELQGTVRDTGTVSGIDRLVVYVTNAAGEIVRLQGGSGAIAGFVEADVLNEADATYDDYRMVIDNRLEEGNDSGAAGDGDGIPEHLTLSAGTYQWSGIFDSTLVDDGVVTVHVMAEDYAGNASSTTSAAFVANNRPVIDSIVLGTDLDGNTTVEADEYTSPITTGFAATNYTARNDLLYIGVNASGGNGTLRFSVTHEGVEQNATLVNNTLVIDTSDELYESSSPNDQAFVITVYDSTSSDDADPTNELSDSITVNLTIDNDDETAPTLSVAPLGRIYNETSDDADKALQAVADYEENIAMSGDDRLGHVEYATDSLYNGADADVSGTVIFRGKVEDDQNIGLITARIPGYNGGAAFNIYDGAPLSGPDWEFTVDGAEYLTDTYGHAFNWSFQWNTASLAGVVADDLEIEFTVYDASNNDNLVAAAVPPEAEIVVDVVPYITSLARDGAYNTIRSRQGWYVFRRAETVTVNGFNLSSGGTDTIVFGAGTSVAVPDGSTTSFSVEVPVDAASGELQLIVDGIPALNNVNDNTPDWNREASLAHPGSDLWTDDRYVHIWQSDDTDAGNNRGYFTGSDDPEYPAMTIDGTGVLYASWSNYADARIWYGPNNGGPDDVYRAYDPSEHTDIHYGARPSVVWNANLYGNGTWDPAGAGGVYVWDANANAALTGTGNAYESELLYHDQRLMQFVNQRIVTSGNDIHVSYYDAETKAMKYWHHTSNTNPPYSRSWINLDGGNDEHDSTTTVTSPGGWARVDAISVTTGDTVAAGDILVSLSTGVDVTAPFGGVVTAISVANGDWVNSDEVVQIDTANTRIRDNGGASRSTAAGEFSAIDVTPTNNYPVVAYYDITNSTVRLARSTATNPDATQWAVQDVMDTNDANYDFSGKYISMRIDSQGYVHLAFFRNSSGDLVYMKSTNNPTDGSTAYIFGDSVTVDSNGSVGVWADVTLLNDRPYISYLDSSLVNTFDGAKLAYYDPALEVETGDDAGEPDTADGWEYMNAPMNYEVESVRTSIEADVGSDNFWTAAIGYSSSDYYRIGYYVE